MELCTFTHRDDRVIDSSQLKAADRSHVVYTTHSATCLVQSAAGTCSFFSIFGVFVRPSCSFWKCSFITILLCTSRLFTEQRGFYYLPPQLTFPPPVGSVCHQCLGMTWRGLSIFLGFPDFLENISRRRTRWHNVECETFHRSLLHTTPKFPTSHWQPLWHFLISGRLHLDCGSTGM